MGFKVLIAGNESKLTIIITISFVSLTAKQF